MEYWNVDLNKEVTHFNAFLSRGILPIPHPVHYKFTLSPIFPEPLSADRQALFHHSSIPVFQLCLPATCPPSAALQALAGGSLSPARSCLAVAGGLRRGARERSELSSYLGSLMFFRWKNIAYRYS